MTLVIAILIIAATDLSWAWLWLVIPAWWLHLVWQDQVSRTTASRVARRVEFNEQIRDAKEKVDGIKIKRH